jgi:thiosulfate/3-mercaptopyruvate sulfurtransferase
MLPSAPLAALESALPSPLIEPLELAARLDDPSWAIIDCRFELARPAWGASAFATGHIPNAQYADLDGDLSGARGAASGRHPLPQVAELAATFGRLGIDAGVQVVAYDQGNGVFAARLWWLLRWLGHTQASVLNGGFAAWERAGLPVSKREVSRPARQFLARPDAAAYLTTAQIAALLGQDAFARGERALIDARAADRFAGENETLDPVAGHIPGARNHPFSTNLADDGRFLTARELKQRWQHSLAGQAATQLIAMCGSGVTACHNLLALEIAGLPGARLYAGSWSEWIRDPARPIARGPQ